MNPQDYGRAYETSFGNTVRLLSSRGVRYQAAMEIAQAAWVRGFEKRSQLCSPDRVGVWVNSIALNLLRDEYRRPETSWPVSLDMPCSAPMLDQAMATQVLASCSRREAELLKRCYVDGYSMREIATLMGVEETSVRVRLHRLRQRLGKRKRELRGWTASHTVSDRR